MSPPRLVKDLGVQVHVFGGGRQGSDRRRVCLQVRADVHSGEGPGQPGPEPQRRGQRRRRRGHQHAEGHQPAGAGPALRPEGWSSQVHAGPQTPGGLTCVLLHVQDGVDTMASTLGDLTRAATRSSQGLDSLQQQVEQDRVAAEKLLRDGRASGQVPSALLFKAGTSCRGRSQDASGPPGAPGLLHRDLQPDSSPSPRFLLSRWRSC